MNNTNVIISVNSSKDIEKITDNTKYINLAIDNYDSDMINYFLTYGQNYSYSDSINGNNGFIYTSYDTFKEGEEIINRIINNLPINLTDLEKVRYLYITIGQIISIDINNLEEKNETISFNNISMINNIWGCLLLKKCSNISICKLLMLLCTRLNIKSELISNNINGNIANKIYIDNSFIVIDLYNDLYNIQGKFITNYFDKYNNDKNMDKKVHYIDKDYSDNYIDNELKSINYTDEKVLDRIFEVTEKYLDISHIGTNELSKIYKHIFDKYCPNYDIRINNLYLNDENREHFIVIYYNDKYYSYNYNKKHFVIIDYNTLYNNIKNKKVGIYENEKFSLLEGIVL